MNFLREWIRLCNAAVTPVTKLCVYRMRLRTQPYLAGVCTKDMVRNRCRLCRFGGLNRGQSAPADQNVGFYSVRDTHWSQRLSSTWDCFLQGSPLAISLDPPDTVTPTASVVTIRTLHVPLASNVLHTLTAHLFWIPDKTKQPSVCSLLWVSALLKC